MPFWHTRPRPSGRCQIQALAPYLPWPPYGGNRGRGDFAAPQKGKPLTKELTVKPAAEYISVRQDTLDRVAKNGRIPWSWGVDPLTGCKQRMFQIDDLNAYRDRQRERLTARLAQLDEVAR